MAERIVKKVKIEVSDDGSLKRVNKSSRELNRNMKGLSQQSSNASKNFSKQAQGMQGILVPAYAEVAARVFALTAAYQALSRASDFRILMQGQAEYAKRTGKNMGQISKQVQRAAKGMLSFADASSAVALASTSGISSGQITRMTKLAVDSSTALGRSVTDTMDRLTRGIVKAEPEILDEIGVIIRLDKVYKDYAESVSKSTQELSEGEKAHARFTAITNQLEQKFGGIADNIDPNYMRAAASSIMDVVMQLSSAVSKVFDPILKFLAETKTAIVVILAVIMKTLAGKILPIFGSFGEAIAKYPVKMGRNVELLTEKIKRMNVEIVKSRNISANAGVALDKANDPKFRGAAYRTGATSRSQQMTNLRSMRATNIRMSSALGTGDSATYKGQTFSRKMLEKRIADEMRLRSEIGKTHKQSEVYWKKATANAARFNKVMAQTKMLFASAASSAAQYFTITKNLIADQGVIRGTIAGVKLIAVHWKAAGVAAGFYQKAIKGVTAATAVLGVVAAGAAAAVNALFGIVMWITLIISLGKMLLNMFVDFDTPFKRAADAARTLNDELKEQEVLFSQKHSGINFEGAAASFDQAMENATFADNFATALYESTSKAMKALSVDMGEMGFWEGAFDWMKSLFGMGSEQYQMKAINRALNLTRSGPGGAEIMAGIREKHGVTGSYEDRSEYEKAYGVYGSSLVDASKASYANFDKTPEGIAAQKTIKTVFKTMNDYLASPEFEEHPDKAAKLLEIYTDLTKAQKQAAESAKEVRENLSEMTSSFEALSKAEKKFTDTLLTKTVVHDMAVEQQKLIDLFAKKSTTNENKVLALVEAGLVPKGSLDTRAGRDLTNAMEKGDQEATQTAALKFFGQIEGNIKTYLGGLDDMIKKDKEFTVAISERLVLEQELALLRKFAPNTSKTAQLQLELRIAQKRLAVEAFSLKMMKAQNIRAYINDPKKGKNQIYSQEKITQASTQYQSNFQKASLNYGENEALYLAGLEQSGRSQSIKGLYRAKRADLEAQKSGFSTAGEYSTAKGFLKMEEQRAYAIDFNKIVDSIGLSAARTEDNIRIMKSTIDNTGAGAEQFVERLVEQGWGKFLDKGVLDPKNITQLLKLTSGNKEETRLPGKIKAATLEIQKLELEQQYRGESKGMLEFRKKVAEIEMNTATEWVKQEEKRLALAVAIKKARGELRTAQLEHDIGWLRDSLKTIGDAFGNAVKGAFNDLFMNKGFSMDKFRTTLAQGFASAASTNIGNVAQNAVFGNKGFLANAMRGTALAPFVDDLFPKSQLEVAKDQLAELQKHTLIFAGQGLTTSLFNTKGNTPAPDAQGAIATFIQSLFSKIFGGANGGIASGGFRAFANGGMVNKPTLGLLGEGKYNEAVVPLPDGKSIPIKGSTGDVTVNVNIDSDGNSQVEADGGESAKKLGYMVSQAVQSELVQQQRPGGLLNSYG